MLPKDALKVIPKDYFDTETGTLRILHEEEWRSLGITQVSRPPVIRGTNVAEHGMATL